MAAQGWPGGEHGRGGPGGRSSGPAREPPAVFQQPAPPDGHTPQTAGSAQFVFPKSIPGAERGSILRGLRQTTRPGASSFLPLPGIAWFSSASEAGPSRPHAGGGDRVWPRALAVSCLPRSSRSRGSTSQAGLSRRGVVSSARRHAHRPAGPAGSRRLNRSQTRLRICFPPRRPRVAEFLQEEPRAGPPNPRGRDASFRQVQEACGELGGGPMTPQRPWARPRGRGCVTGECGGRGWRPRSRDTSSRESWVASRGWGPRDRTRGTSRKEMKPHGVRVHPWGCRTVTSADTAANPPEVPSRSTTGPWPSPTRGGPPRLCPAPRAGGTWHSGPCPPSPRGDAAT